MKAALDTNVLAYAEGVNGADMQSAALAVLDDIPREGLVVPVQTLAELYFLLVRKAGWPPSEARTTVLRWRDSLAVADTTASTLTDALDLASDHHFRIWDAMILAAAADADCRLLLTRDLQAGFTWRGVTVVDPFTPERHPLIGAMIESHP